MPAAGSAAAAAAAAAAAPAAASAEHGVLLRLNAITSSSPSSSASSVWSCKQVEGRRQSKVEYRGCQLLLLLSAVDRSVLTAVRTDLAARFLLAYCSLVAPKLLM
jgi:hypothetical protein